eukprot:6623362-Prorocentrum_lima.AAC.1
MEREAWCGASGSSAAGVQISTSCMASACTSAVACRGGVAEDAAMAAMREAEAAASGGQAA